MKKAKRNAKMTDNFETATNKHNVFYTDTRENNGTSAAKQDINNMRCSVNNEISNIEHERYYVKRVINWLEDKDQRLSKAESILFEISKLAKHSMRERRTVLEKHVAQDDINSLVNEFNSFIKRYISAEEAMGQIFDDKITSMLSCDALEKLNSRNFSVTLTDDKRSLGKTICELNSTIKMVRKNQFELESCIDLLHDEYDKSYIKETNLLASLSSISRPDKIEDEIEMILCGTKS